MVKVPIVKRDHVIKPSDRKKIIKAYGANYTEFVAPVLDKAKVVSRTGNPYSKSAIRDFVTAKRHNQKVKIAIMKDVEKLLKK